MTRKALINGFIIAHLLMLGLWNLPDTPWRTTLASHAVESYLYWTGLRQYWGMFAAGGSTVRYRVEADVTLQDGSRVTWKFPPDDGWGPWERTRRIMHVSWGAYVVDHREAWPDTARYVARLHAHPGNPPIKVALIMCTAEIPPPSAAYEPITPPAGYPQRTTLFEYDVQPGDFP